ncbi:MAG: M20/M25/M40 family metallo-hydrolase [Methanomassiliicoccales archaeon]|jgi:acetylornithine deacetylase/succinyl-diaminopimelate desuccinylase-like protein|nr:M20/M25/M40 family metallo-hydrolase [Methanomassiliicoccales archaeon]
MRNEILSTLLDLLEIRSDMHADKSIIVNYAKKILEEIGFEIAIAGDKSYPALIASRGKGGIALSGHLDTVPIGDGWTRKQGEIDGDRIYGRGTTDMKGAVASMLVAARDLAREDVPCTLLLTTDEEEKMLGALKLSQFEAVRTAHAIIICEPTSLNVACREKGVFRFRLITRGKAAHSSQCWLGENAILKMNNLLIKLSDLAQVPAGPTDKMTMCFTTIQGGTKDNVVPDRCQTEIDVRFPAPLTVKDVEALIRSRLVGEDYEIETIYGLEPFESDRDSKIVKMLTTCLKSAIVDVPYATEAPRYQPANPSIYICGPGVPTLAHVPDEYVELSALIKMHAALVKLGRTVFENKSQG